MWRVMVIVLLAFGVVGFGACALCASVYGLTARNASEFLGIAFAAAVLTGLCIWGIRRLRLGRGAPAPDGPPPPASE